MDRISVIIPTVQKNLKVLSLLTNLLCNDPVVDEVLLINNIDKPLQSHNSKLHILQQEKNLYVNASWNLGVELSKNDTFLIINDDILPCIDFCSVIVKSGILNREDTGLVGIDPSFISQKARNTETLEYPVRGKMVFFKELDKFMGTGDWGSAFFGRKENYYKIPDDIRIIYGDNYLLYNNKKNGKINYTICNINFNHIHSLSSASPEFREIIKSDVFNSKKYFN